MNFHNDTITAIATAPGEAGVAVVRLSGPNAITVAAKLFKCSDPPLAKRATGTLVYGHFKYRGEQIDELLVLIMKKPHSYTREDVIEFQCHGGNLTSRRILRALLAEGVRLAEPGEFTARAFLNGRLDLLQAEAVADLIRAKTERAATAALNQMKGSLSKEINMLFDKLIALAATIETTLDFSTDEIEPVPPGTLISELSIITKHINRIIATCDEGRLLRHGARVVISGRPNVGKSTLLNKLLDADRAIVSNIPGTTRDTIEESIILDGFPVILTDTAGLRETECAIEEEGVRRSINQIELADVHIYLIDVSEDIIEEDEKNLRRHDHRKTILVRNKIDLNSKCEYSPLPGIHEISASLINNIGVLEIRKAIIELIESGMEISEGPHSTISERHHQILIQVSDELEQAKCLLNSAHEGFEVLTVSHLRTASEQIATLIGKNYHTELLNQVFSKFCIGK